MVRPEKRKKKEKKRAKHEKQKNRSSSEDDSSSSAEEWVETSAPKSDNERAKRDEWMDASDFVPTFSNNELKAKTNKNKKEEDRQLSSLDKPGQHERELNPYWKDGGRGLPATEEEASKVVSYKSVGDGGVDWLRRAYRRVLDQAKEEGRSAEDVAKERWGSLERLKALLQDAEEKAGFRGQCSNDRQQRSSSYQSSRHGSKQERTFQKPRDDEHSFCKPRDEKRIFRRPRNEEHSFSKPKDEERTFQRPRDDERSFHKPTGEESKFQRSRNEERSYYKPKDEERTFRRTRDGERTFQRLRDEEGSFQKQTDEERTFHRPRDEERTFHKHGGENENSNNRRSNNSSNYQSERPRWQKADFKSKSESTFKRPREVDKAVGGESSKDLESSNVRKDIVTISTGEELKKKEVVELVQVTLTKKEMNELGAKIIKAELLGNTELAEKLKARLNAAKEVTANDTSTSSSSKPEVVLLTQSNSRGFVSPLVCGSTSGSVSTSGSKRKMNKLETHRDGERICYFQDDSKYSLQQMFQKEKFTTADDETAMYLRLARGKSRLKTDDDFTIDDALLNRQERYEPDERQAERQRNRAIKEHKQLSKISENCSFCIDSAQMQKHLIVALGTKAYVSLPSCKSLEDGHCYIVPMSHVPATTHLDEDIWEEVQSFRRKLTKMFRTQEKDVVFMETSLHLRRHPHAYLECIPLSLDLGSLAPMYFKKAILECDTEWAENKRLVDLSKKDVRHSVPKGLPYFAVDFGLDGGFAHVVEDEQLFPDYFGREILGGMLELEPRIWKKPFKENFKDQSQKVLEFEKWWKTFELDLK